MNNNFYMEDEESVLTSHLENILCFDVEYDEDEAQENLHFMRDAVSGLISVMKRMDPLFSEVYTRIVHAGSFDEGLRITNADEFDLQIVLDFPFLASSFTIALHRADSPFLTYQLKDSPQRVLYSNHQWVRPFKKLSHFFDDDGFLSSSQVLAWIHGLMEKAFLSDDFKIPKTVSDIKRKPQTSTCPAFTLEITGEDSGRTVSVDLVPVLNTCSTKIPRKMHKSKRFRQLLQNKNGTQWFLVPKPSKDHRDNDEVSQILWRSTFPEAEKELLFNTGCLKNMIRIFKRLRDVNGNWRKPIFSYVLKTFFMREFDKYPDLNYWSEDNLGQVFLESLEKFRDAMERCYIPDYFNPKANMINFIKPDAARNIAGRVKNIISDLQEDPDTIKDVFQSTY